MTDDLKRTAPSGYELSKVPGWSKLKRVKLPVTGAGANDRRYSVNSNPLLVFQTLVVTLWYDLGGRDRDSLFPWTAPASTFSRLLKAWTKDEDDHALRDAWLSYMDLLTSGQKQEWLEKLLAQANSWRDWDEASRLASRVHSPWFQIILRETKRVAK